MSQTICIMGDSGAGKTTSLRNLDPETTYIIDCDKKGLSWRGWRKSFNVEAKNYYVTDYPAEVRKILHGISDLRPNIKVIVVDTINGLMVADEMRRAKEKGYDKWMDLAQSVWDLINDALTLRDDLTVIFMAHAQTEVNDFGYQFTHIKTNGRKLDKIVLESKFKTVLLAKCADGNYVFETQAKNSTAKSPMDMLETFEIPNDVTLVLKEMEDFR